jgi:hypothetical protein
MEAPLLRLRNSPIALETRMAWIGMADRDKFIEDVLDCSIIYRILCLKWFIRPTKKNIDNSFRDFAVPKGIDGFDILSLTYSDVQSNYQAAFGPHRRLLTVIDPLGCIDIDPIVASLFGKTAEGFLEA